MNQNEYTNFVGSEDWKAIRNMILQDRGSFCEKCKGWFEPNLVQVHHKSYSKQFGSEDDQDLMVVCKCCHKELHQDLEFFDGNVSKSLRVHKEVVIKSTEIL